MQYNLDPAHLASLSTEILHFELGDAQKLIRHHESRDSHWGKTCLLAEQKRLAALRAEWRRRRSEP